MGAYALHFNRTTLVGSTPGMSTLLFINPSAGVGIEILRIWAGQEDTNTSDQQPYQFVTQVSAFPTLTSMTPASLDRRSPASAITGGTAGAAGTAGVNASVEGAGAKTVLWSGQFNILTGLLWVPASPEERIILPAGHASGFGLYFPAAPSTVANWGAGLTYRELR